MAFINGKRIVFAPTINISGYRDGRVAELLSGDIVEIKASDFEGANVTKIRDYALNNETKLKSVYLPDGITEIGNYAFNGCTDLATIRIPTSVRKIGNYAFSDTDISGFEGLDVLSLDSIGQYAFANCFQLKTLKLADIYSIPNNLFSNSGLSSITLPNTLTKINSSAFSQCRGLERIVIPDSVTTIDSGAFQYCSALTDVTLSKSLTLIPNLLFASCTKLTHVDIPASVTEIRLNAFSNCTALEYIDLTAYGTSGVFPALSLFATDTCTFEIRVPKGRKAELAGKVNWNNFADKIVEV